MKKRQIRKLHDEVRKSEIELERIIKDINKGLRELYNMPDNSFGGVDTESDKGRHMMCDIKDKYLNSFERIKTKYKNIEVGISNKEHLSLINYFNLYCRPIKILKV